jgi:hypothetical protein
MSKICEKIVCENSGVMAKTGQKNVKNGAISGLFENCVRKYLAFQEILRKTAFKTGPKRLKNRPAKSAYFRRNLP